ncbi:MAG TPA: hypothetical protein VF820_03365 [Patescibacteria group bacterium]
MLDILKQNPFVASLLLAVVASLLGYIWGQRTKRFDQYYTQSSESLKDACSPIFHELRQIINSKHNEKQEILIREFFERYTGKESKIYKIGNVDIINDFYELSDSYESWTRLRTEDQMSEMFDKLKHFYFIIEKEYYDTIKSIFYKYKWNRFILSKIYPARIFFEFFRVIHDTMLFILIVSFISWFYIFYVVHFCKDNVYAKILLPYSSISFNFFESIVLLYMMLLFLSLGTLSSLSYYDESRILKMLYRITRNLIKLISPKLYKKIHLYCQNRREKKKRGYTSNYSRRTKNESSNTNESQG